jgi:hypothetical protein
MRLAVGGWRLAVGGWRLGDGGTKSEKAIRQIRRTKNYIVIIAAI